MNLFEKFNLSPQLLTAIKNLGYETPTEIQQESIPLILAGKDVIGESATGSGKTLAFGCGIIENVIPKKGLQSLVLTPTRELAEQVKESLCKISFQKQLKIISVYGGVAINPQINDLSRAEVVIATPGRILDHLQRRTIDLSKVKVLVLDEADRMFDLGFIDDVKRIISQCPTNRQTLFFSATISSRVKELANRFMKDPQEVYAKKLVDPSKLTQVYYDVNKNMKLSLLVHLLQHENSGLVMVFCNTRRTTDFVVKNLRGNKVDAIAIHGGFTQNKRSKTLELFNDAKVGVLVCTDVAARGLHVDNVSHIYNYELPADPKDYVHRIGRTARAGEEGKVINLLSDSDHDNFSRILREYRVFKINNTEIPQMQKIAAVKVEESRTSSGRGGFSRERSGRGYSREDSSWERPRRGGFSREREASSGRSSFRGRAPFRDREASSERSSFRGRASFRDREVSSEKPIREFSRNSLSQQDYRKDFSREDEPSSLRKEFSSHGFGFSPRNEQSSPKRDHSYRTNSSERKESLFDRRKKPNFRRKNYSSPRER